VKLKKDASRGGKIAGIARKELEKELGRSVISDENYLIKKNLEKKKK
jgi:DNA-damage-inducible protein D